MRWKQNLALNNEMRMNEMKTNFAFNNDDGKKKLYTWKLFAKNYLHKKINK